MKDEKLAEFLLRKEFNSWLGKDKTIKRIDDYIKSHYTLTPCKVSKNKVFYHYTEWEGWRFYLKALRHGDLKSIWGHLKDNFKKDDTESGD